MDIVVKQREKFHLVEFIPFACVLNEFPSCECWVKKVRIFNTKKWLKSKWLKSEWVKSEWLKSEFPQITANSLELFLCGITTPQWKFATWSGSQSFSILSGLESNQCWVISEVWLALIFNHFARAWTAGLHSATRIAPIQHDAMTKFATGQSFTVYLQSPLTVWTRRSFWRAQNPTSTKPIGRFFTPLCIALIDSTRSISFLLSAKMQLLKFNITSFSLFLISFCHSILKHNLLKPMRILHYLTA